MEPLLNIPAILAIAFAGSILAFITHHALPKFRTAVVLLLTLIPAYLVWQLPADSSMIYFSLGGFDLSWGTNPYSRLFSLLIAGIGVLSTIYSLAFMKNKARLGFFYLAFLATIASMYGIVFSQDLLSLFFFWEIMTWSSFLMVIYYRFENQAAGIRYFVFSAVGAYALLTAIVYLYSFTGDLSLTATFRIIPQLSTSQISLITILFLLGFGVKSALMPVHVWAPDAYRSAPSPFTALFSGVLSKMGIFGMGLVLFKFMGGLEQGHIIREVLAWMGGLTALLATFYAVFQTDAKKLLAYSSIAQLGYIIIGLAVGTPLSVMAAIFLALLHGIFKSMLFMGVGSVFHQTGSLDLNELTGLIRKMPLSFVTVLMGIITVSGVPPLGGFVGKWMLYESLLTSGHYFLVAVTFISSTAAFLYLYRLIFSIFLGQEEKEYEHVREVSWVMWVPMLILAGLTMLAGAMPGLFFEPIAEAMKYLGFQQVDWQMSVLFNSWGNQVDMLAVITSIFSVFLLGLAFITWKNYKTTRYVTTRDIHTSGEIPTENENLTYAVDFYRPFERAAAPVFKYKVTRIYESFAKNAELIFDLLRHVYTGNAQTYALYVVIFLVVLIVFSGWIFGIQI
ncbi:MAG: proton-conducting transporter membrane subunit [Candidatus Marinimicrobia bacterium]|nr:proton-conducting transporter membrane subunit [Candidatus Neomarinimicrobiota bacterium]